MNGTHYFTYECEPGEHVFWSASENKDYLKGNLKANSTYIVEVRPKMGGFKAAVKLHPVNQNDEKTLKKVNKIISKKEEVVLKGKEEDMSFLIQSGLSKYEEIKGGVKEIDPEWVF